MFTVSNVSYHTHGKQILTDISLTVPDGGSFFCILGPNGAGKSTFIKLLCGLIKGEGCIEVAGRRVADYEKKELAKVVGYVPQVSPTDIHFTVKDYIMTGRYPYQTAFGGITPADTEIVRAVIQTTGLEAMTERDMSTLSGGERQRVMIATALAQETRVLLLDEPTIYLDPKSASEVLQLLKKVHQNGVTVVMVTHDINQALLYGTDFAGIKDGKLHFISDNAEDVAYTYLNSLFSMPFDVLTHHGRVQVLQGVRI